MTSHTSSHQNEVKPLYPGKLRKSEHGQIWVLLALALGVLLVFVGMSIDYGRAYVAKTTLAKAVDAAALKGMQNINLGTGSLPNCSTTSGAGAAALEAFNVNYNSVPNLSVSTPTPSICFSQDVNNNTVIAVNATASINTYFIRIADMFGGNFNTLSVGASAQAQRNPLIMSLILDVSASMESNGGSTALSPAVENFIANFDPGNNDTVDWVSVVTFGTFANVNLANTQPLKGPVDSVMATNFWPGGIVNYTNSMAGLTLGQTQILSKTLSPNTIRAAVFFTDGWPNIIQDNLKCGSGSTTTNVLYCGCDQGDESLNLCNSTPIQFFNPSNCQTNNTCGAVPGGCTATTFPDQQTGATQSLNNTNYCGGPAPGQSPLGSDAMYRALKVAQAMQANDIFVYSIGMGTAITGANNAVAEEFLREVANDPNAATYNPNLPQGEAVFASSSSELQQVFQVIASKILLRLSK
jgi:Flp pilus assembly protein TadG